jgi:hypothetical protein
MTTNFESTSASTQGYSKDSDSTSSSSTYGQITKSKHLCSGKTTLINNFFESIFETMYDSVFAHSDYFRHCSKNKVLLKYGHCSNSRFNHQYSTQ